MRASTSFHDLTHIWPDGDTVLSGASLDLDAGRHGLVGANGAGKSTIIDLLAGRLTPTSGTVHVEGRVAHLPQDPVIADTVGATFGVDWAEAWRAEMTLDRLGLDLTLDRDVRTLSGGEQVLLALGAQLLDDPDILLLDEPTNNLDRPARARLGEVMREFRGVLVIASHDRELLSLVDNIVEVRHGKLRKFGGNFDHYRDIIDAEQEAAERDVRDAEGALRTQRRELAETQVKLARRQRYGKKMQENKREPKIVMGNRKRAAQESAAKLKGDQQDDVAKAREQLDAAEQQVRTDRVIHVDLPATQVPSSRLVLTMTEVELARTGRLVDLSIQGPERIAISGRNGAGKSTLLATALGHLDPVAGEVRLRVPARHLPQRLDLLDPDLTIVQNVRAAAPDASETEIRSQLAKFLFRARRADQVVGTLSGGELLRATLATILLAEPAPQLLVLDEPTNNLDLASVAHLVEALASYRGSLLVVSHDQRFLDDLDLDREIELDYND